MLTAIYNFLETNFSTLATICPVSASEGASYPLILYELTSDHPIRALDGPVGYTSDLRLEIMSADHAQTDSIAQTIDAVLDGYRGQLGDFTSGGLALDSLTLAQLSTLTLSELAGLPLDNEENVGNVGASIRRLDSAESDTVFDPSEDKWIHCWRAEYQCRWKNIT
jgi:hypothetical protein